VRGAARFLTVLAAVVIVAGIVSLYLLYRPTSLGTALDVVGVYVSLSISNPWLWVLLALTVFSALGARFAERREIEAMRETRYAVDTDLPAAAVQEPIAVGGEDIELPQVYEPPPVAPGLGSRLERHLGRRADLLSWLDDLLAGAIEAGASDVHLQPTAEKTRVKVRVDGNLGEIGRLPRELHPRLLRRIKVMARLPPYRSEAAQDGRIGLETPTGPVDVRLSIVPTQHGEKVALRFGASSSSLLELFELGMPPGECASFQRILGQPQGLIVLTGPTGSGKTTTLYAALQHIHKARGETAHMATIEEPVEIDLPYANQTEVERARGLDFAKGLRALLRQDPDVLMVGEVRDRETAATAVEAGLTGHLILTTLHADSAAGIFNRLIDLDVEPFLVASATVASLSQRLVRRLCPECRRPAEPKARQAAEIERLALGSGEHAYYSAPGCEACHGSGFAGRLAIFELLEMSRELRQKVTAQEPTHRLMEAAKAEGMTPLAENAVRRAWEGEISLDELLRVAS